VREDLLDHGTVLDAGDDPKRPAAGGAALNIDAEDPSQTLCPADRGAPGALFGLARRLGMFGLDSSDALGTRTASSGGHAHPEGIKAR